ncbi:MAG: NUDIX hydrolase [bacterium]
MTASSILLKDRKILLLKRVETTRLFPGCWTFPGGKAEPGESPEKTAIRETREEVNLNFLPTQLFVINTFEDRLMYRYLGDWSGQIQIQYEEVTDFGWFNYQDTNGLTLAFDYREVVDLLFSNGFIE